MTSFDNPTFIDSDDTANLDVLAQARNYSKAMQTLVIEKLRLTSGPQTILDVGAGLGTHAKAIANRVNNRVIALEPTLVKSVEHRDVSFHNKPEELPNHSFSAIFSLNVLEHVYDEQVLLKTMRQKLSAEGRMLILVPAHMELWTPMDDYVGHVRRYSLKSLIKAVQQADLYVEDFGWFDRTGYLATRLLQGLTYLRLRNPQWTGAVNPKELKWFDRLFALSEPAMRWCTGIPGKNVWVVCRIPPKRR